MRDGLDKFFCELGFIQKLLLYVAAFFLSMNGSKLRLMEW